MARFRAHPFSNLNRRIKYPLILALTISAAAVYCSLEPESRGWNELGPNILSELLGIAVTVWIIDALLERQASRRVLDAAFESRARDLYLFVEFFSDLRAFDEEAYDRLRRAFPLNVERENGVRIVRFCLTLERSRLSSAAAILQDIARDFAAELNGTARQDLAEAADLLERLAGELSLLDESVPTHPSAETDSIAALVCQLGNFLDKYTMVSTVRGQFFGSRLLRRH